MDGFTVKSDGYEALAVQEPQESGLKEATERSQFRSIVAVSGNVRFSQDVQGGSWKRAAFTKPLVVAATNERMVSEFRLAENCLT